MGKKCIDCGIETITAERCSKCYYKKYYKEYNQKPEIKIKRKEYMREYKKDNPDKIKAATKKWQKTNPDKLIYIIKRWRKNNPKKFNATNNKYKKIPQVNISNRLRERLRIVLKIYTNNGKIKLSNKYGINYKSIIEHLKPFPENMSEYHIDHIRPLCSFNFINKDGTQNLEEIKKAFAPENHQWLLAPQNLSKGGKWEY